MLKFTDFLNEEVETGQTGQTNLSQVVREPAPATPSPAAPKGKLLDVVRTFIDKRKTSPTPAANQQQDTLTLKVSNYGTNTPLKIITQSGEINAIIVAGEKGKNRKFKLKSSTIQEIKNLLDQQNQTNAGDKSIINPATGVAFEKGKQEIYFFSFIDKKNPQKTTLRFVDSNNKDIEGGFIPVVIKNIQNSF